MGQQIQELFRRETSRVKSIAFHPTYPVFITANHCGTICIWDYLHCQTIAAIQEHVGSVRVVKFHPSGEIFATGGDDKIVRVWNYKTRECIQKFKGHTDYVRSVDFHPTHPFILSGSDDSTVKVWNYYTGSLLSSSSGHHHYVMAVAFLDTNHFVSGSLDHTIGIWDCSKLFAANSSLMIPKVILRQFIDGHDRGINTLLFIKNKENFNVKNKLQCLINSGNILISGGDDKELKIWKFDGQALSLEKTLYSHDSGVTSLYYDGSTLFAGAEDGEITAYENFSSYKKILLDSRVWAMAGKRCYLAVGTDDGLSVYLNMPNSLIYGRSGLYTYYIKDSALYKSSDIKNSEKVCEINDNVSRIQAYNEQIVLQEKGKFKIINGKGMAETNKGNGVFYDERLFILDNGKLISNGEIVADELKKDSFLIPSELGIFIVSKKSLSLYSSDRLVGTFNANFEIQDVVASGKEIAVLGQDKIVFLDASLKYTKQHSEMVQIVGAIFAEEDQDLFIYTTAKQIKYIYDGEMGILQSNENCNLQRPVALDGENLTVLSSFGLECIPLTMGELRFKKAVNKNEGILEAIENEQLPGRAPLEYLIEKGLGGVALPYITDDASKFVLLLNEGQYSEALELADTPEMLKKIAYKIISDPKDCADEKILEIAEECLQKAGCARDLFFFYLSSNNLKKLKEINSEEYNDIIKVMLEDTSVFKNKATETALAQKERCVDKDVSIKDDLTAIVSDLSIKGEIPVVLQENKDSEETSNKTEYATLNDSDSYTIISEGNTNTTK
ncbi:coatomer subunit alpha [Enteropsectra breve]|nr:coatomer subunit alpha [Enteropsectra breve]